MEISSKIRSRVDPTDTEVGFVPSGVAMQYYEICHRELWFHENGIGIDGDNPHILRGGRVDESAYGSESETMVVHNTIAPDMLEDGRIIEIKPSSTIESGARLQLLYYLWYFDEVLDISTDGVLAHPTERSRTEVTLGESERAEVERAIEAVIDIVERDAPPELEKKPFCDSCAYQDICWM